MNNFDNKDNGNSARSQIEFFQTLAKAYSSGGGEEKLIKDIFENVSRQKAEGKLNNESIDKFVKNILPMLNGSQKTRLLDMVEKLKQI